MAPGGRCPPWRQAANQSPDLYLGSFSTLVFRRTCQRCAVAYFRRRTVCSALRSSAGWEAEGEPASGNRDRFLGARLFVLIPSTPFLLSVPTPDCLDDVTAQERVGQVPVLVIIEKFSLFQHLYRRCCWQEAGAESPGLDLPAQAPRLREFQPASCCLAR